MKRFLSLFLSITVLVAMLIVPVSADNAPTVTVKNIVGTKTSGDEVELDVSVTNNPGFTNFDWKVEYDADHLELKAFKTTDIPLIAESNIATGKIAAAGTSVCDKDGDLFKVVFEVKENAPSGEEKVSIVSENIKNDGVTVAFTYVEGGFNIDNIANSPSGDIPTGDIPTGDVPTGDIPTGDVPTGDIPTGDIPSGDIPSGPVSTGGGGGVSSYSVKFETNGANSIDTQRVKMNDVVKKPQDPSKEGYTFAGWYLDEKLTQAYDFSSLVKRSFTLYAKWTPTEEKLNEITLPFSDVKDTDWFANAVKFAYMNNIVNGITNTEFAPNSNLTRAMLVTIIYRLAGEPAVNKSVPFGDVGLDAYYASAVSWAQQNEIVNGISETQFAPNYNITREQIAAIIYRYSQNKGYDVSKAENVDLSSYKDADEISEYAVLAMKYAVGSGLMGGRTATTLNPKDNATRAEVVQVFYNLLK